MPAECLSADGTISYMIRQCVGHTKTHMPPWHLFLEYSGRTRSKDGRDVGTGQRHDQVLPCPAQQNRKQPCCLFSHLQSLSLLAPSTPTTNNRFAHTFAHLSLAEVVTPHSLNHVEIRKSGPSLRLSFSLVVTNNRLHFIPLYPTLYWF